MIQDLPQILLMNNFLLKLTRVGSWQLRTLSDTYPERRHGSLFSTGLVPKNYNFTRCIVIDTVLVAPAAPPFSSVLPTFPENFAILG